ncbi:MAG: sodium/glutamate symporter [Gemmatimonadales bacterium]
MPTLSLDLIETLAVAALVLFVGYGLGRRVPFLDRYNIPAPVIGGFLLALVIFTLRQSGVVAFEFNTTLQVPFLIAFFTTIGLGASFGLLKVGGPQVIIFLIISSVFAILQNVLGVGLAQVLGIDPLVGLIASSMTLTGGHGTGAAFGKLLEEQYQMPGAVTLALAAATFGLVAGGIMGSPLATWLIKRDRLRSTATPQEIEHTPQVDPNAALDAEIDTEVLGDAPTAYKLLKGMAVILFAMAVGGLLSRWLGQFMTLPAYIGAMIVAAIVRNLDDTFRFIKIDQRAVDDLGTMALSLFLSMALMSLRIWELLDLAIPVLIILVAQTILMGAFAFFVTYRIMGRDYDAAIIAGGHCGFGMGATSNAVATMRAIVEKFGPSPKAFLIVPMVGAFFIDFTNAIFIRAFINFLR